MVPGCFPDMVLFILGEGRGQDIRHIMSGEATDLSYVGELLSKLEWVRESDPGFSSVTSISTSVTGMRKEEGLQREAWELKIPGHFL